jgi:hypothetical protein
MRRSRTIDLVVAAVLALPLYTPTADEGFVMPPGDPSTRVFYGVWGDLIYRVEDNGDRVIDFGGAGYKGMGEQAVPNAAQLAHLPSLRLQGGANVQNAINQVGRWPMQPDGFRGVIYLAGGHSAGFKLNASGIVLIGRQMNPDVDGETTLTFTGNDQKAIKIDGQDGEPTTRGPEIRIASYRVPTGSRSFLVEDPSGFSVGDRVEIKLTPNQTWVRDIGMNLEAWTPNDLEKKMRRVVTSVNGNEINIDEPTVITIWDRHGGATINTVEGGGPIRNVGILGVSIEGKPVSSSSTLPGIAIFAGFAKDVFLRFVRTEGFKRSALYVAAGTENLTAYSVHYRGAGPTSGSHRYGFQIGGQQNFIYEARSFSARHAFVINPGSTGGNVFWKAESTGSLHESGGHRHWAGATLWDQVYIKNDQLTARYVKLPNINHGWGAVNNVSWNSRGRQGLNDVIFRNPAHAYNIKQSHITQFRSLNRAQREDRAGGVQFREYVIGDYDDGVMAGSVDEHVASPEWSAGLGELAALDVPLGGRTVAMTFNLNLQPGERVVGGQLSIRRGGEGGTTRINLGGMYSLGRAASVGTLDLATMLDAIRDGKLNVAVTSDSADATVDFAMLKLKLGSVPDLADEPYLVDGKMRLVWPSVSGRSYSIFSSPDLASESWTLERAGVVATPPANELLLDAGSEDCRFFRVQLEPE